MNIPDLPLERRLSARLLDVLIRAGLVLGLAVLCYDIFSPFLALFVWTLILAVTLYPLHQKLASSLGGRQGLAATLLVLIAAVLIVTPTAILTGALAESITDLVAHVRDHSLQIPAPPAKVAEWPLVGDRIHALWSSAHTDLPAVIRTYASNLADLSKQALGVAARLAGSVVLFLVAFAIAGIVMAFGRSGSTAALSIFNRVVGVERGEEFTRLCTLTIRAVAQGVLGVALIQAIVIGIIMLIAGIPFAGVLAAIVLVLGIAQIPALLVSLPVIGYVWSSGDYSTVMAITHSVLLVLAGMLDNVLKPLMLGRGVDAPMPVVLVGALGGMASNGILGMFVGATLLTLGYQIFMGWVRSNPDGATASAPGSAAPTER